MYEKMLHGRRILHFRFAPPVTNLDDTSTRDTQPPFDGAPGYMWSVYYYWWAFLRLSKPYKECCENGGAGELSDLYTYFGDVRDDDFMHWWKSGGHPQGSKNRIHSGRKIFSHGIRFPIREIHDPLLDKEGEDKRIKRWWVNDATGNCLLAIRYGSKVLELEKGKTAIVVGNPDQLVPTIETVIAAINAGELDGHLAQMGLSRPIRKAAK